MLPMATFSHLVMATDLDSRSDLAARLALSIAKDNGAKLTFVHVYPPPVSVYGMYAISAATISSDELERAARKAMHEWLARLGGTGSPLEAVVRPGDAATIVVEEVQTQKADLLIVGTRARRGVSHVLLGSTAEKLVRLSPVPVLVAHAS